MNTKVFLLISIALVFAACTSKTSLESTIGSGEPSTGNIIAMDPTGVTVGGVKAEDVQAVIAEGSEGVFAVEPVSGGIKLVPLQNVTLIAGALYEIIVKTAKADVTYTIKAEMPAGAIMAFNAATCPEGWSVFNGGKGRTLVGAGSGNTDADGTALTARTVGQAGGREFTTGIPVAATAASTVAPSPEVNLSLAKSGPVIVTGYSDSPADTTLSGEKADSNMMPYAVVLYCQKD